MTFHPKCIVAATITETDKTGSICKHFVTALHVQLIFVNPFQEVVS